MEILGNEILIKCWVLYCRIRFQARLSMGSSVSVLELELVHDVITDHVSLRDIEEHDRLAAEDKANSAVTS